MNNQLLMDYGKNPANYGKREDAQLIHQEKNHSCGEDVTFYIDFKDPQDQLSEIEKISFEAEGRIITIAASSILAEEIEGKSIAIIEEIDQEALLDLLEIETLTPKRLKSALLPLMTLINIHRKINKTEAIGFEELMNNND